MVVRSKAAPKGKLNTRELLWSAFGFFFAPFSELYGLGKELIALGKHGSDYTSAENTTDGRGAILPFTKSFSRIAGLFMAGLCFAGFLGALLVPIPGVAPLYLASLGLGFKILTILKAACIINAYTVVGRTAGAAMGAVLDAPHVKKINEDFKKTSITKRISLVLNVVTTGLCGEFTKGLDQIIQKIKKRLRIKTKVIAPSPSPSPNGVELTSPVSETSPSISESHRAVMDELEKQRKFEEKMERETRVDSECPARHSQDSIDVDASSVAAPTVLSRSGASEGFHGTFDVDHLANDDQSRLSDAAQTNTPHRPK